jgi:hypothetical protein
MHQPITRSARPRQCWSSLQNQLAGALPAYSCVHVSPRMWKAIFALAAILMLWSGPGMCIALLMPSLFHSVINAHVSRHVQSDNQKKVSQIAFMIAHVLQSYAAALTACEWSGCNQYQPTATCKLS